MTNDIPFTQEQIQRLTELSRLPPEEQKRLLPDLLKTLSPEQVQYLREQQGQATRQGATSCPFCLIAQKQLQSSIIYEDDLVLAVLDIKPATKGHTLLFPKTHVVDFASLPAATLTHLFFVAHHLFPLYEEALSCAGVNLFVANGSVAGQTVEHVLLHLIPRYPDDGVHFSFEGRAVPQEDLARLQQQLTEQLAKSPVPSRELQPSQQPQSSPQQEPVYEEEGDPVPDFR